MCHNWWLRFHLHIQVTLLQSEQHFVQHFWHSYKMKLCYRIETLKTPTTILLSYEHSTDHYSLVFTYMTGQVELQNQYICPSVHDTLALLMSHLTALWREQPLNGRPLVDLVRACQDWKRQWYFTLTERRMNNERFCGCFNVRLISQHFPTHLPGVAPLLAHHTANSNQSRNLIMFSHSLHLVVVK